MKRFLRILLLALPLSFLIGLWWGHFQNEDNTDLAQTQFDLRILAQKDSLPLSLLESFEKTNNVKVEYIEAEDIASFQQLLTAASYDLIAFKSYHLKEVAKNPLIQELEKENLYNSKFIQADFWPTNKYNAQKAIPYAWGVNGFLGKKGSAFSKAYLALFDKSKSVQPGLFYLSE
ncbi:MAG: hypothetical protein KDD40_12580, partial [Bdellovibrionales bacterium]|nr:hypothetical protein [Bdellovibrionales bacterium]